MEGKQGEQRRGMKGVGGMGKGAAAEMLEGQKANEGKEEEKMAEVKEKQFILEFVC